MVRAKLRHHTPICLDVGARFTRALQLRHAGGRWVTEASSSFGTTTDPAEFGHDDAARLRGVIDRQGFAGRGVVALLPEALTDATAFELPARADAAARAQIARVELARAADEAPDAIEAGWWPVPAPARAGDTLHAMGLTCPTADAQRWFDTLEANRLQPVRFDAHLSCGGEIARRVADDPEAITAAVDIGWSAARVVIVVAGQPVYHRQREALGLKRLCEKFAGRRGVTLDVAEAAIARSADNTDSHRRTASQLCTTLAHEVLAETETAMKYAEHRYRDRSRGEVLVFGGGAAIEPVASALRADELPARVVLPADLCEHAAAPASATFTAVTALALMETD